MVPQRYFGYPFGRPYISGNRTSVWWGPKWVTYSVLLILGIIVLVLLLTLEPPKHNATRTKRSEGDPCIKRYGGIELEYVLRETTAWTFDVCSVIDCQGKDSSYRGSLVYLCWNLDVNKYCLEEGKADFLWCDAWGMVIINSGGWAPKSDSAQTRWFRKWWSAISFQRDVHPTKNPVTLSLNWDVSPSTQKNSLSIYLVLGIDQLGVDPLGLIKINIVRFRPVSAAPGLGPTIPTNTTETVLRGIQGSDYTKWSPQQILELSTGFTGDNTWLRWMAGQAAETGMEDCVACALARPRLVVLPAPLFPEKDPIGYNCIINLTKGNTKGNCTTLATIFPAIKNETRTGPFIKPRGGNFTCFVRDSLDREALVLGYIGINMCIRVINDTSQTIGLWARAGIYYYCGTRSLYIRLPLNVKGLCAMVRLGAPITLIGHRHGGVTDSDRRKRDVQDQFDLMKNTPTYIDAIGIPRGVPEEHKLVNQIAAGFENFPIISALFPVTPNKNVDRINFVHYNVMRLANLTRDAVEGLKDQLAATSLMAVQNRMALDMLLAEKGGVCVMFGEACCTFIPNNTAPDGSVTKALDGLKALSKEMQEASGTDNLITGWMEKQFGKYKALVMSALTSVAVFFAIIITCGCCCIPCIRNLVERLISTMIEKKEPPERAVMMSLLDHGESEDEEVLLEEV